MYLEYWKVGGMYNPIFTYYMRDVLLYWQAAVSDVQDKLAVLDTTHVEHIDARLQVLKFFLVFATIVRHIDVCNSKSLKSGWKRRNILLGLGIEVSVFG